MYNTAFRSPRASHEDDRLTLVLISIARAHVQNTQPLTFKLWRGRVCKAMAVSVKKNVCLIVIDGWGISDETNGERAVISSIKIHVVKQLHAK